MVHPIEIEKGRKLTEGLVIARFGVHLADNIARLLIGVNLQTLVRIATMQ